MNIGENDRELSEDELNQVTGGGSPHELGKPVWISGAYYSEVLTAIPQYSHLPPWVQNLGGK
jgi:bacteriocin-like protein